jgi:hypothetical protein
MFVFVAQQQGVTRILRLINLWEQRLPLDAQAFLGVKSPMLGFYESAFGFSFTIPRTMVNDP